MNKVTLLGTCVYQADIKPKGSRTFRRADVSTLIEFELAAITAADLVRDAVVVMPVDERKFYHHRRDKAPELTSYAGWEGALWQPMTSRDHPRVTVEQYEQSLRHPPHHLRRPYGDPIMDARISSASPKDHGYIEDKDIYDADALVGGAMEWTNKADAVAAHHLASKLLIAVDGEIWRRHPGPTWEVQRSTGNNYKFGAVLLEAEAACRLADDLFRLDRLEQARELCIARWGKAEVYGAIERMDPRFVTRDDVGCMFHSHLALLVHKGEHFMPYLKPEATQAFVELYRVLKPKTPWTPYATTDAHFVSERMAILKEAMADRSLPNRLLEIGKEIIAGFLAVEERIRLERSALHTEAPAVDSTDDEAIASLGAHA
jgi:hypothetical protein